MVQICQFMNMKHSLLPVHDTNDTRPKAKTNFKQKGEMIVVLKKIMVQYIIL